MSKPDFLYVTYIKTTPEKLWAALTNSEFTRQYWFDTEIKSDWKEGSPIAFYPHGENTANIVGTVLRSNPPRELAYTWGFPDLTASSEEPSRVTFTLEKDGDLVKLTVVHDQFTPGSAGIARVSKGWPAVLSSLKSMLESGTPLSYPNWAVCG